MKALLFLLLAAIVAAKRVTVFVDTAAKGVSKDDQSDLQTLLVEKFDHYGRQLLSGVSSIEIYQFSDRPSLVLPKTRVTQNTTSVIHRVFTDMRFDPEQNADWNAALEFTDISSDVVYFFVDEPPVGKDPHDTAMALIRRLRIIPVGIGNNVNDAWLKRIAGPCGVWGCMRGVNYFHF